MRNGFTLVETLIVVAITLFLSGMLLSYNRSTDNQVVLAAEQARVAGVLFRAKSFALQKNVQRGATEACGFGVHFEKTGGRLILYGDIPSPGENCAASDNAYVPGEEIEEVVLNPRVAIYSYSEDPTATSFDIFVRSPYLETVGAGTITLELTATGDTRDIVVGEGGAIGTP
ncbi:MAG: type II secretion system protein [Candidatus Brennerbacteria bacterium]